MRHVPTSMYYPGTSVIHRLNPIYKMICFIILIVSTILSRTPAEYFIAGGFTVLIMLLTRIPVVYLLGSVRRLYGFFIVIVAMNTFFYGSGEPWFSWWIFRPSYEGLLQGINVAIHVVILLIIGNILVLTTPPLSLTLAMEVLLSPLRFIKVPVDQIAMILSVAIQFIPTLFEETDEIRTAQTARGARFDSPKLFEKGKAVLPLFIPIFLSSFKRADELSLAMESRGYRVNHKRRRKKRDKPRQVDIISLLICACICVLFIFVL